LNHVLSLAQPIGAGKYNEKMNWILSSRPLVICLLFNLLTGCGPRPDSPLHLSPVNLVPYLTRTAVYNPTPTLPATDTPAPSPTPNLYPIAAGDTLSKIAQRFGIALDALLAANPGIQPAQLSVGQTITIPSASQTPVLELFSTPVPIDLGPVSCFSSVDGLTCLAPVHNPNSEPLENVKVQITLFSEDGRPADSQDAILPLNILQPGQSLPASAYFPGIPSALTALSQLKTSTSLTPGDQRYVPAFIQNLFVSIDWNGSSAQITGQVGVPGGERSASSIWLVAVACDVNGQIVGFRRWDWKGSIPAGASQPFSMIVYSQGPEIDHIEMQVEARP
jgi:LysM repeat protein